MGHCTGVWHYVVLGEASIYPAFIPLIITMVIAAFVIHAKDPFGNKEMAILYLGAYLAIALLGPGKWSADRK